MGYVKEALEIDIARTFGGIELACENFDVNDMVSRNSIDAKVAIYISVPKLCGLLNLHKELFPEESKYDNMIVYFEGKLLEMTDEMEKVYRGLAIKERIKKS